ncbi:hypothetical protein Tco_0222975 [Tanacetum coccineum]
MLHASGSSDRVCSQPKVLDELQDKTTGTNKGTGTKLGVSDAPKYLSESENEYWGDSGDDDNDDDSNEVTKDDDEDDVESDANEDKEASDSEKRDSDKDENLMLNQNDDKEEEKEEEDVRTPDSFEFKDDDEEYDELYKDVNVRSKVAEHEEKTEGSKQSSSVSSDFASNFLTWITFHQSLINTINESLENVVLAKSSSQPQSTYEAATSLTEFELNKILLDKLEKSKSYRAAEQHRNLYDAPVISYQLDKDLFDSYGKTYSLKRDREEKDKNEDPLVGLDRGLKKMKTSKDVEPSRGSK